MAASARPRVPRRRTPRRSARRRLFAGSTAGPRSAAAISAGPAPRRAASSRPARSPARVLRALPDDEHADRGARQHDQVGHQASPLATASPRSLADAIPAELRPGRAGLRDGRVAGGRLAGRARAARWPAGRGHRGGGRRGVRGAVALAGARGSGRAGRGVMVDRGGGGGIERRWCQRTAVARHRTAVARRHPAVAQRYPPAPIPCPSQRSPAYSPCMCLPAFRCEVYRCQAWSLPRCTTLRQAISR